MKEQRIVHLSILDKPVHIIHDVFPGRELTGILGVVSEQHDILRFESMMTCGSW